MKVKQSDAERLVIVDFPLWIGLICFPTSLFLLYGFIRYLGRGECQMDETPPGLLSGFLLFFFGGALFTKRSVFDFDAVRRQLTWRRQGLLDAKGGIVPFDQIKYAVVQISTGSESGFSYRVALSTAAGDIPLTLSYDSYNDKQCDQIRMTINDLLQANIASEIENDILHMVESGRKIDAIKLTTKRYGYDLTQAKQFVEGLMK